MAPIPSFIFDFDSTFTSTEALDVLADIVLEGGDKQDNLDRISEITRLGMSGELSFKKSLQERMQLLSGTRSDIEKLVEILKGKVSVSIQEHKPFFKKYAHHIFIVSSGFKEFIVPVVADYSIKSSHVYANSFTWQKNQITGYDTQNPLSSDGGKPKVVKALNLTHPVIVIGDGFTDYEIKQEGFAQLFIAYTENISRTSVTRNADFIAPTFNHFLNYIIHDKALLPQA